MEVKTNLSRLLLKFDGSFAKHGLYSLVKGQRSAVCEQCTYLVTVELDNTRSDCWVAQVLLERWEWRKKTTSVTLWALGETKKHDQPHNWRHHGHLEIVDWWSTRILQLQKFERPMWPWPLTYWPGTGMRHIIPSWIVFVPHKNIIPEIGNEPQCGHGMQDGGMEGQSETNIPSQLCVRTGIIIKTSKLLNMVAIYLLWLESIVNLLHLPKSSKFASASAGMVLVA